MSATVKDSCGQSAAGVRGGIRLADDGDLDPAQVASLEQLIRCLRYLRDRAGRPSTRELEARTRHARGNLPGTDLQRVPLGRNAISDMLSARKFPNRKAFFLTFVEACGVNLEFDRRWDHAWNRLYVQRRERQDHGDEELASVPRTADGGKKLESKWDVFDPEVIERLLEVRPRFPMRSLTELREAIEPVAASRAARRASPKLCEDLVSLSRQLQELGEDNRFHQDDQDGERVRERYRDVDAQFHRILLKGSQNEMFDALAGTVEKALNFRIQSDYEGTLGPGPGTGENQRFPPRPTPLALWLHRGLAAAVDDGYPSAAETFSRAILAEVHRYPLPLLIRIALEHAHEELDPRCMGADWEQFTEAIRAAIGNTEAGS